MINHFIYNHFICKERKMSEEKIREMEEELQEIVGEALFKKPQCTCFCN